MYTLLSTLTLVPTLASATIWGTCTPKPTPSPDLDKLRYPTTLTAIYTCTHNFSSIAPPFFDRIVYSDHEQTLTTIAPLPSKPTAFPYSHVVTVSGVLSRTEWVGPLYTDPAYPLPPERKQTFLSTVTDVDTVVVEGTARAEATGV